MKATAPDDEEVGLPRGVDQRFYRENFAVAMDRLAEAWKKAETRYGYEMESPDISARAVMGIALVLALESHHNKRLDKNRALELVSLDDLKRHAIDLS